MCDSMCVIILFVCDYICMCARHSRLSRPFNPLVASCMLQDKRLKIQQTEQLTKRKQCARIECMPTLDVLQNCK